MLKTNFNGAVSEDLNAECISVVVCNSPEEIMVALSEIIPMRSSMFALEALAARRAV